VEASAGLKDDKQRKVLLRSVVVVAQKGLGVAPDVIRAFSAYLFVLISPRGSQVHHGMRQGTAMLRHETALLRSNQHQHAAQLTNWSATYDCSEVLRLRRSDKSGSDAGRVVAFRTLTTSMGPVAFQPSLSSL
jgi:hypothetical protein